MTTPYSANTLNQYTVIDSLTTPQYDNRGTLASVQYPAVAGFGGSGSPAWTYTYDSQNRMLTASNGTTTTTLAYDGRNRCISRTTSGATIHYVYDGWNLIEEYTVSGGAPWLSRAYLHGVGVDEVIGQRAFNSSGAGGVFYHHHADGLGNVVALASKNAPAPKIVERYRYDVFGMPTFHTTNGTLREVGGVPVRSSDYGNRFLFTGREWLADLGIYDYRNRMYSPQLGRFLQTDPIGFDAADVNLYRYVGNNPINHIDPLGLYDPDDPRFNRTKHNPWTDDKSVDELAWDAERRNFPRSQQHRHLDPYDGAYRHCVAACLLKRRYGPGGTLCVKVWDRINEDPSSENSRGDMRGEQVGLQAASGTGTCEQECLSRYPSPDPSGP